jgi:hypothetical protein
LDPFLAHDYSRAASRHLVACEVSEGTAIVFDCSIRVAFLGGLRGTSLASRAVRDPVLDTLDGGETLIEECFP